jgi:hypothetical protein
VHRPATTVATRRVAMAVEHLGGRATAPGLCLAGRGAPATGCQAGYRWLWAWRRPDPAPTRGDPAKTELELGQIRLRRQS